MSEATQKLLDATETDVDTDEMDKDELIETAIEKKQAEEYREAVALANEALERDPEYAPAYHERGNCLQINQRFEEALEEYDKTLELDPEFGTAYRNRGIDYLKMGEYEKAVEDLTQAIELKTDIAYLYSNRGIAYFNLEEYEKAIDDYTRATEIDPEYPVSYLNLAELYLSLEKPGRALENAEQALNASDDQTLVELSLMFVLICKIALGEDTAEEMDRYREVCSEEPIKRWSFDEIESWLESADLAADKEEEIREVMDVLRGHKDESSFL